MNDTDCCEDLRVDAQRVAQAEQQMVTVDVADELADTFQALSDPTRIRLISALAGAELCVGELAAVLNMGVSAVSHQLRLLRRLRVVKHRRVGRHIYYALDDEHILTIYRCGLDHIHHT